MGNFKLHTRVVAFIYDKDEYKDEIKFIKNAARFLSGRENLRIGIVDDPKLVKKFKLKYGVQFFPHIGMTSMVLKRYDGEFKVFDITSGEDQAFHSWINKNSLKEVHELSNEAYKI